jgi:hypothetical protein
MFSIGFIDYFLDEWHANNYPKWIAEASRGEMAVTHAYAMIDSPLNGRCTAKWCEDMNIAKCDTIDEVIANCDGLIVLSPDNAEMHEELCKRPLISGKPVYVDKVFAPDLSTAKRIFDIAEKSGTPCYSSSALRYAGEYADLPIDDIRAICSWGPGKFGTYSIHQIEPIVMLMCGSAKRVLALPAERGINLSIAFEDGRWATLTCFEEESPFAMNLLVSGCNRALKVESDFFKAFIHDLVGFFHDRRERVPHEETLRIISIIETGTKAIKNPYTWVKCES